MGHLSSLSFVPMPSPSTRKTLEILLIFFLVIAGLYFAKPFLVPICFAGLFAMLFLPFSRKLEKAGVRRGLATVLCMLTFLAAILAIIALVSWQVTNLTSDLGNLEEKANTIINQVREFISRTFGISMEQQQQAIEQQSGMATGLISKLGTSIMGLIVNFVLVLVYTFLFMYYRSHIKRFILKVIPKKDDDNAENAIKGIEKVALQYLTGMGLMILCLWIMYSIGFSLLGLKNSIFFAMLCAFFEIIPYIGNITGNLLAALMAYTQGGGMPMIIGILITYSLVQFLQTYILEPLVVGTNVNINPLFTILGLVAGELIWGIAGLILAIPLLAIFKIICDHIPSLKPYGYLIGQEKGADKGIVEKIKGMFK